MSHECNCEYCGYDDDDPLAEPKGISAIVAKIDDVKLSALWSLRKVFVVRSLQWTEVTQATYLRIKHLRMARNQI